MIEYLNYLKIPFEVQNMYHRACETGDIAYPVGLLISQSAAFAQ